MRSALCIAALALAGCSSSESPPNAPPGGGGGGGGSTSGAADANTGGGNDSGVQGVSGQLCLIADLQNPNLCSSGTSLTGIQIEEAATGATATTDSIGRFTIAAPPSGDRARLKVGFSDPLYHNVFVTVAVGGDTVPVPIVAESTWQTLLGAVGVAEAQGTATLATYLVSSGVAVSGLEVIPPTGAAAPFYDGPGGPLDWQSGGITGTHGAAIMVGVPASDPEVSFAVSTAGGLQIVDNVAILDGALTFVTYELL